MTLARPFGLSNLIRTWFLSTLRLPEDAPEPFSVSIVLLNSAQAGKQTFYREHIPARIAPGRSERRKRG